MKLCPWPSMELIVYNQNCETYAPSKGFVMKKPWDPIFGSSLIGTTLFALSIGQLTQSDKRLLCCSDTIYDVPKSNHWNLHNQFKRTETICQILKHSTDKLTEPRLRIGIKSKKNHTGLTSWTVNSLFSEINVWLLQFDPWPKLIGINIHSNISFSNNCL